MRVQPNQPTNTPAASVSPASTGITKLTDAECGYHYCELPKDVFFMESIAQHEEFMPGTAFLPVGRFVNGRREAHIYAMTATSTEAQHVLGPITTGKDNTTDITIFGSALSSTGILYLCAFNRNSIVAVDLKTQNPRAVFEIGNVPAPNDVCVHPAKPGVLFVAGGTSQTTFCTGTTFTNAARGQVFRLELTLNDETGAPVSLDKRLVTASGLTTLAGIHVQNDNLWVAELQDMLVQPNASSQTKKTVADNKNKPVEVWSGNDGNRHVWLADNVDTMPIKDTNDEIILCPAYTTLPQALVKHILDRTGRASAASYFSQLVSAAIEGEAFGTALRDPEVTLNFTNTFIKKGKDPEPVRIILMDSNNQAPSAMHFEIDLVQTRKDHQPLKIRDLETGKVKGKRHFFNEQVTHAAHISSDNGQGFVACVNFEQTRVLLLNDEKFQEAWKKTSLLQQPAFVQK